MIILTQSFASRFFFLRVVKQILAWLNNYLVTLLTLIIPKNGEKNLLSIFFFNSEKDFFPFLELFFKGRRLHPFLSYLLIYKKKLTRTLFNPSFANRHSRMTRLSENRDSFNKKFDSEFDLKAAAKMSNTSCLKLNEAFFSNFESELLPGIARKS